MGRARSVLVGHNTLRQLFSSTDACETYLPFMQDRKSMPNPSPTYYTTLAAKPLRCWCIWCDCQGPAAAASAAAADAEPDVLGQDYAFHQAERK